MGQVSPSSAIVNSGGVTLPGPVLAMIEARNALARTVYFHRLGGIRDRSYENQRYHASGLNLVIADSLWWHGAFRRGTPESQAAHRAAIDPLPYSVAVGYSRTKKDKGAIICKRLGTDRPCA